MFYTWRRCNRNVSLQPFQIEIGVKRHNDENDVDIRAENLLVNDVKLTFFQYPFDIKATKQSDVPFRLPALLDLAAMKAYALGRRSKWKDYVDLYFLLTKYFTLEQVCERATAIFGELFSEKMFRAQLSYFEDVDYTEQVDYIISNPPTDDEIKNRLTELSVAEL